MRTSSAGRDAILPHSQRWMLLSAWLLALIAYTHANTSSALADNVCRQQNTDRTHSNTGARTARREMQHCSDGPTFGTFRAPHIPRQKARHGSDAVGTAGRFLSASSNRSLRLSPSCRRFIYHFIKCSIFRFKFIHNGENSIEWMEDVAVSWYIMLEHFPQYAVFGWRRM